MSDVTQLSDEALVDQFATNVFRYETDRTPSPWKEQVDLLEAELLRRLALRDQQVTLADCRSVVEGMFQFDTDCGYLIDAQDTITALAQLPWPHGSGVNGE